jgi:hypothetical protein
VQRKYQSLILIKKNCRAGADRPIEEIDSKVAIAFGKRVAEIIVE